MSTVLEKLLYSVLSAGLALGVSSKMAYSQVDKLVGAKGDIAINGCPTATGHFTNSIIFFILLFTMMIMFNIVKSPEHKRSLGLMAKYSFYGTLIYLIVTSTQMYKLVGNLTGGATADANGCATASGLLLHGLFYLLIIFCVMFFPKDC